ncbi:sn1-specific diacylglycerol lipase alpha-like [Olea europaea subsp. europaea]|uniref:sn-1-specific diacylglycerol lipase n=1 Tax=Olea europaea subsp. europaea TaxID=158383 RepID=A0A8S0TM53_OLEEU|nr:sn1-specific diacylglycerol lipase alpha-like [Olea europaea subsp. europaea]
MANDAKFSKSDTTETGVGSDESDEGVASTTTTTMTTRGDAHQNPAGARRNQVGPKVEKNQISQPLAHNEPTTDDNILHHERRESLSLSEIEAMAKRNAKHQKKWHRRFKIFFCCLGFKKSNKESIADVASIFAEYYSDLDAPSSDVAAGFVLLSKYQEAQRQWILEHGKEQNLGVQQYLSGVPVREDTKFIDLSIAEDSHLINNLIYYMNYSLAIFGWPFQMVDEPFRLCCICPYLRLSSCCRTNNAKSKQRKAEKEAERERKELENEAKKKEKKSKKDKSERDKKKSRNNPAEENDNKLDGSQVQQADCVNGRAEVSDRETTSARIAPGQLSDESEFPVILGDNCCGCYAASAELRLSQHNYEIIYISYKSSVSVVPFLVAADHSKRTIVVAIRGSMTLADMVTDLNGTVDKLPIENCPDDWLCHRGITSAAVYVKKALIEKRILERAFKSQPELGSEDYTLVFCGHSLGAGTAAILGVLFYPQYPTLKAYLYSPPGGILSMPVVEYTKQFATGVVLGNDCVARLGIAQLERLRYHTVLSLKSAQKSPGRIIARAMCPSICCGSNEVEYDPEHSIDLLHGTSGRPFDYRGRKIPFQVQPQILYVPGRLIHIVKNYSFRSKTQRLWGGPIFQAIWVENSTYDRILISEGMFLDHLPHNLMTSMKMLFSRTLPARRESKQSASSAVEVAPRVQNAPPPGSRPINEMPSEHEITVAEVTQAKNKQEDEHDLAVAKNVIEDENNNNSNNHNGSQDLNNNNNDEKFYPNLNRNHSSSLGEIKNSSRSESVSSDLSNSQRL